MCTKTNIKQTIGNDKRNTEDVRNLSIEEIRARYVAIVSVSQSVSQ